jgi:RND family efflux transporter MFP subunit
MYRVQRILPWTGVVTAMLLLGGCEKIQALLPARNSPSGAPADKPAVPAQSAATTAGPAAPAGPPVSVTLVTAKTRSLPVLLEATGTVVPVASVDVRPQVSSVVTQVHVREGQFVRAGELLFTLDSRSDEANVAKMRAQMAKDEAALADAKRQFARSRELLEKNFVSQGAVDTNQALVNAQTAAVGADRAAVDAALVTLDFARVRAPSTGRLGAIAVFPGSAVQANQTSLVTLTQLDPINVSFNVPQRYLGDLLQASNSGAAKVNASLPDSPAKLVGRLQFVDNAVDAASGTIKVKARFENRESRLWPGAFATVSLTLRTLDDAIVIPQASIIQSARGPIVYVVDAGKAASRPVTVIAAQGDDAAVGGLKAGERIVLDGRQNLRPGSAVVERSRDGGPGRANGAPATGSAAAPTGAASTSASGPVASPPSAATPTSAPATQSGPASAKASP